MLRYVEFEAPCGTLLDVVYTNDCEHIPMLLGDLEQWLTNDPENNFLGLDLEYTADQEDVVVIQIAYKNRVMVFNWESSVKHCPPLMDFLVNRGVHFASVDITNDKIKMMNTWGIEIPAGCHIDLQSFPDLQLRGPDKKTGMADMAAWLIDTRYRDMKTSFPKKQHRMWGENPLDWINLTYAAIDAYVSFELYRLITAEP